MAKSGIALFDHPENAEHPGFFGEIAVQEQMSILHHPPDELEDDLFPSEIWQSMSTKVLRRRQMLNGIISAM